MGKEFIDQELEFAAKQFITGEYLYPFVWYTKKTCS
jgi:hypothetical protein